MNKGWRIIVGIVLVTLVLGAVCIVVGRLTGGDVQRVTENLNTYYGLDAYVQAYTDYARELWQYLAG